MTNVAEVLADHQWHHTRDTHCTCGFRTPLAQLAVEGFIAHVAEQVQPLIDAEKQRAVEEALRNDHRVAWDYKPGLEVVCSCGVVLSCYGLTRALSSIFGQHIREARRPASTEEGS